MTVLYICEPGAVLRRDGESWVVTAAPKHGVHDILARILGHQLQAAVLPTVCTHLFSEKNQP